MNLNKRRNKEIGKKERKEEQMNELTVCQPTLFDSD